MSQAVANDQRDTHVFRCAIPFQKTDGWGLAMADRKKQTFPRKVDREVYPEPPHRFTGAKIGLTFENSRSDYPAPRRAPDGAPNVVVVILDDTGYGLPSAYGGLVHTPTAERLAAEGLRYCQFHTTALCAPTRAALLTGRNHHSVSQGVVAEMATGFPGYVGIIPKSCAFVSEILSQNGYATGWWGKNHNVPDNATGPTGPFDHWPHRRGFDHFYGFLSGETDNFYPNLIRNGEAVDPPASPGEGYHLMNDLVDDCIGWIRTQKAAAPDRPLFIHFAPLAAHGPHQPHPDFVGRHDGRFDMGWEKYREIVHARQMELGVIPQGTALTPRPSEIPAWDDFSDEEKKLFALQMETFADYFEHADTELGRIVDTLKAMGEWENTLFFYILGDNGSSAEGGLHGTLNETATMSGVEPNIQETIERQDEWGKPGSTPHYAAGWAWAGDTPFQWMKQIASHFGGTRNGLIASWPKVIDDHGAKRYQFHHVVDIVPTILEVVGIAEPTMFEGVTQKPMEGTSLAYTFDRQNAQAPGTHTVQYFEMLGNRAIYADGWMACCRHGRLPWQTSGSADFDDDVWELYHVASDFSQSENLASLYPEKLREMQDLFLVEAAKYDVLPLDDRFVERTDTTLRPGPLTGRTRIVLAPGMTRIPEGSAPKTNNVDHSITFRAEIPEENAEGVLICMGGDWSGWSLFVDGGRLRYHYNWLNYRRYDIISEEKLPAGDVELRLEFTCKNPQQRGGPAIVRLYCNGDLVGAGRIPRQIPGRVSETLDVGRDSLSPVCPEYRDKLPFEFNGKLGEVVMDLGEAARVTTRELVEEYLRHD